MLAELATAVTAVKACDNELTLHDTGIKARESLLGLSKHAKAVKAI